MAVQDDRRESEVRELVGLRAGEARSGVDAFLDFNSGGSKYSTPVELKSTTVGSVSTARDVGLGHIENGDPACGCSASMTQVVPS